MENDWLTDELMQRASKLIQDIDGIASQGTIYVVSRALYEAEKRGREEERELVPIWGWWHEGAFGGVTAKQDVAEAYSKNGFEVHQLAAIRSGQ